VVALELLDVVRMTTAAVAVAAGLVQVGVWIAYGFPDWMSL
jgi:hypothetical protein